MRNLLPALFLLLSLPASAMRVAKFTVPPGVLSVTNADVLTTPIQFQQDYGYSVQCVWTGGAIAGTIQLEDTIDGTDWDTITGTAQAVSGPGHFTWNVAAANYDQFRVHFVYTSGSGTVTCAAETKGP